MTVSSRSDSSFALGARTGRTRYQPRHGLGGGRHRAPSESYRGVHRAERFGFLALFGSGRHQAGYQSRNDKHPFFRPGGTVYHSANNPREYSYIT